MYIPVRRCSEMEHLSYTCVGWGDAHSQRLTAFQRSNCWRKTSTTKEGKLICFFYKVVLFYPLPGTVWQDR